MRRTRGPAPPTAAPSLKTPALGHELPAATPADRMLFLQRAAGNRAVTSIQGAIGPPGRPLDPATRGLMEERFDRDLSSVRVHTDAHAAASAEQIGAQAYTVGNEIAFGHDQYAPNTTEGQRLLAHELAHAVQQRDPAAPPPSNDPAGAVETSAREAANNVAAGQPVAAAMPSAGVGVSMNAVPERELAVMEAEKFVAESNQREKEEEEQEKARDAYVSRDRRPTTLSLLGDDSVTEAGLAIDEAIEGPAKQRKQEEEDQRLEAEVADAEGRFDRFQVIRIDLQEHGRGRGAQREHLDKLTARDRAILRHYGAKWPKVGTDHVVSQRSIVAALDKWAAAEDVSLFGEETAKKWAARDRFDIEWTRGSKPAIQSVGGGVSARIARAVTDDPAQWANAAEFGQNTTGVLSTAARFKVDRYTPQVQGYNPNWRYSGIQPTKPADIVTKNPKDQPSMPPTDITNGKFFSRPDRDWSKVQPTGPSFEDVRMDLKLNAPGAVRYRSAAAAARDARQSGLVNAKRPGFHTHSVASSIRRTFGLSGRQHESAHIVPQAVYRRLRDMGYTVNGRNVSEGRAFTTLLPKRAHNAFDSRWVPQWNAAVEAAQNGGPPVTAKDLYRWVSAAVNSVDPRLMSNDLKGAVNARLRTELFSELGLTDSFVIVPTSPQTPQVPQAPTP